MENTVANDLDNRIISHISRGNMKAYNIIVENHMEEIRSIRNYMMRILNDCIYDARQLNQCFYKAIADLKINLVDLLEEKTVTVNDINPRLKRVI